MHLQNVRIVDRLFIIDLVVENAPLSNVATSFVVIRQLHACYVKCTMNMMMAFNPLYLP